MSKDIEMVNPVLETDETGREILLKVKDLAVTFYNGKKEFRAVHDVNFNVYNGETLSLVGESGSGKTTIGRAIIRINPTSAGEVTFMGKKINGKISKEDQRWVIRNMQMVFQDPAASLNERATIDYIISEGLYNFHLYKDEEDRKQKVLSALEAVGLLAEHATRYPHEFSGGQRQRIGIARAMVMEPKLLIADEPISALDVSIRAQYTMAKHCLWLVNPVPERLPSVVRSSVSIRLLPAKSHSWARRSTVRSPRKISAGSSVTCRWYSRIRLLH